VTRLPFHPSKRAGLLGLPLLALAALALLTWLAVQGAVRDARELRDRELADRLAVLDLQNRLLSLAVSTAAPDLVDDRASLSKVLDRAAVVESGFAAVAGSDSWLDQELDLLRAARREWADAKATLSSAARSIALDGNSSSAIRLGDVKEHLQKAVALLDSLQQSGPAFSVERRVALLVRLTVAVACFAALVVGGLVSVAALALMHRPGASAADDRMQARFSAYGARTEPAGISTGASGEGSAPPTGMTRPMLGREEFVRQLEADLASNEGRHPLSVLLLQVSSSESVDGGQDGFGQTSDLDAVVRGVVSREILPSDRLGSVGIGRFGVILYDTSRALGLAVVEHLRKALHGAEMPGVRDADSAPLFDIGIATFPQDGTSAAELVAAAEEAVPKIPVEPAPPEDGATAEQEPALGAAPAASSEQQMPKAVPVEDTTIPPASRGSEAEGLRATAPRTAAEVGSQAMPSASEEIKAERSVVFGRFLVRRGLLTERELSEAVKIQTEINKHYGVAALEAGLLTLEDFRSCLGYQRQKGVTFRTALLALGVATEETIPELDTVVRDRRVKLGEVLVRRRYMSESLLNHALQEFVGRGHR
jgi:GGDEF domain-containing protein